MLLEAGCGDAFGERGCSDCSDFNARGCGWIVLEAVADMAWEALAAVVLEAMAAVA